ncbi:C4-dicarboxylate ABC transporter substrate-binding protein, partial [Paraburkholderia sp. EG286B]
TSSRSARLVPSLYAWRVKSRIYRWYGALIAIEREALNDTSAAEREGLVERLDKIEESVNGLKMPLAYADQFYVLREHIGFVRARLTRDSEAAAAAAARDVTGEAQPAHSGHPAGSPDHARAHDSGAISRAEARAASHEAHEGREG